MIVAASAVLLIVLSAFAGLKAFGLAYTNSFDPDLKIVPETGSYFVLKDEDLDKIRAIIKHEMEVALPLNVPVIAEAGNGDNWLEAH